MQLQQIPKGSVCYRLKQLRYDDWLTTEEGVKTETDLVFNCSDRIEATTLERFNQDRLFLKNYVVFGAPDGENVQALVFPQSVVHHI